MIKEKRYPILADKQNCTGCCGCVDICKVDAITPFEDKDGHMYVRVDSSKCVGCLKCENFCSSFRSDYGNNKLLESEIFAGWAKDEQLRYNGTSGGVFAALAKAIIDSGGVVVGAFFDGRECVHTIIRKASEIYKLQGSKYVPSDTLGIYKRIEVELESHPVLFTGVGCQCAAVIEYFKCNKYRDRLITVDLVCGGLPSKHLIRKYIKNNGDIDSIVSFRTKDKYELRVNSGGKEVTAPYRALPLMGYMCEMTNRYTCYDCQFAYAHRKSDITIGDLWNLGMYQEERKKGVSIILIHSDVGIGLLRKSDVEMRSISWGDVLPTNPRLVYGTKRIFPPRKHLAEFSERLTYCEFEKLYSNNIGVSDFKWMPFKIYRFICNKYDKLVEKSKIKKILHESNMD